MRLFIAFDIPEKIKKQFVSIKEKIKTKAKIKWVSLENIHLTLKFLGEVADEKINEIKRRLSNVKFKKFDVEVSGIGVFPSENYIRVIWVGLRDSTSMFDLAKEINKQLPEFKNDYPFKAHITIGRVKTIKDREELVKELRKIKIVPQRFSVKEFKLYKSTLTSKGPVYLELAKFP